MGFWSVNVNPGIRVLWRGPGYVAAMTERAATVDAFHRLYYDLGAEGGTWKRTTWMGVPTSKLPIDMWIYQELLYRVRPRLVVETGSYLGGSALYLAQMMDLMGIDGAVLSIDIEALPGRPSHPRISYAHGSSVDPEIVERVWAVAATQDPVMVILDSDHSQRHVREELWAYAPMVTPGSYLIVEDTNVNGHPVFTEHGPGPMEAVADFLASAPPFVVDEDCEKLLVSFNPAGYLRRVVSPD